MLIYPISLSVYHMGTPRELVARYFACVVPLIKSLFLPNLLPSTDRKDTPTDWTLGRKFMLLRDVPFHLMAGDVMIEEMLLQLQKE